LKNRPIFTFSANGVEPARPADGPEDGVGVFGHGPDAARRFPPVVARPFSVARSRRARGTYAGLAAGFGVAGEGDLWLRRGCSIGSCQARRGPP